MFSAVRRLFRKNFVRFHWNISYMAPYNMDRPLPRWLRFLQALLCAVLLCLRKKYPANWAKSGVDIETFGPLGKAVHYFGPHFPSTGVLEGMTRMIHPVAVSFTYPSHFFFVFTSSPIDLHRRLGSSLGGNRDKVSRYTVHVKLNETVIPRFC